ncbi:MAG: hypothetical protein IH576_01045 [Deltaproteobacteria bacterium]|nr:hypothetical protein [Deltaproteobacteria bacterium]
MIAMAGSGGDEGHKPVTVMLPGETVDRLMEFCHDYRLTPDTVVERALEEYFREGDTSH